MNQTIAAIDAQTALYTPTVIAGIQAAEALGANATGPQKAEAVIQATSASLATISPNPNVAGIAALVNLGVQIANLLGVFTHKTKNA